MSLWDYIHMFSKRCSSLPDVVDADIIIVFLSRTACESLIHKLGCLKPQTTHDHLDVAMNHVSGEEAVGVIFIGG